MKRQKITTIFWDAGGVLFSDAEISQPNFKPVLDLLGITAADSDKIFARLWAEKLRLGKITEDQYWQEYIKDSRNKPNI